MLLGKFEGLLNMTNQAVKEKTLSPQEVRAILNTDNKEIVELCKRASIMPRKNSKGMTYFSYEEVKNLRKIQALKANSAQRSASGTSVVTTAQPTAIQNILTSLKTMESTLSDRIAKVIDEKLEGMDEVVVELIRCKTDNETLRQKIVDLNKEVYHLKNKLNSYKAVGLGLYVKKEHHIWE
jgi:predicted HicB family RNase H-like nuclease